MSEFKVADNNLTKCIEAGDCEGLDVATKFNNRGHVKYMQVEFDAAVEDYNEALQLNPKLAVAYYNRGTVFYRLGQFEEAVADMRQAVSLEPRNTEFNEGLAECVKLQLKRTVRS